jgi:hypothetical protein
MTDGPGNTQEFVDLFNEIIQRQTVVLGPDIAVIIAKKVQGLQFSEEGRVTGFEGDAQQILQQLINGYVNLSGLIVRKTIEPLLAKHPSAAVRAVGAAAAASGVNGISSEEKKEEE